MLIPENATFLGEFFEQKDLLLEQSHPLQRREEKSETKNNKVH